MTRFAQILSTGSYVPDRVVTNAEIDELLGESTADWLVANVGIRSVTGCRRNRRRPIW